MAWRPHSRVKVNSSSPRAAGRCDRCGFLFNHSDLQWQFQWAGETLQNLRLLVCDQCLDIPQEQLRARILSADPTPIVNARPEPVAIDGISVDVTNYFTSEDEGFMIVDEDGVTAIISQGDNTGGFPGLPI